MRVSDWLAVASALAAAWSCRRYLAAREAVVTYRLNHLNNTANATVPGLLVFNRVPKVGSQTLWMLLDKLSARNGFGSFSDSAEAKKARGNSENNYLPAPSERKGYYDLLANRSRHEEGPFSYSKHINYLDFEEFEPGFVPIYVNLVRDPVERVISWYYYMRTPWYNLSLDPKSNDTVMTGKMLPIPELKKTLDECVLEGDPSCVYAKGQNVFWEGSAHYSQISFFCGHDPEVCAIFENPAALARAKRNVEERFAVVGVNDSFSTSLNLWLNNTRKTVLVFV